MLPTIVLIPGNMCDHRLWDGADGCLRSALEDKRLAIQDADTTRDSSIPAMAARALADSQGALLPVGFSMGAIVALEMARQAPDRITGMALSGLNAGADLPERSEVRIRQQAQVRGGDLERVIVEELKPNYLAACNRGDKPLLDLLRDMGLALGRDVFVAQSEALRLRDDLRPVLGALSVPVLLACGEEDALCPPAWHREWAERTPQSELHIFGNSGHMLPLEQPQAFASTLLQWIEHQELDR